MVWSPQFRRVPVEGGGGDAYVVGHPLADDFLEFARGRARPNTVRAYAHDLKTFFAVVAKDPADVRAADVMAFVKDQRSARRGMANVVRLSDGSAGLSSATIRRRLAAVSAFLWVPGRPGRCRCRHQPGAPWLADSTAAPGRSWPAAGAFGPATAEDSRAGGSQGAGGRAAHTAGPSHGPGHVVRRAATLRGPRPAPAGLAPGRGGCS